MFGQVQLIPYLFSAMSFRATSRIYNFSSTYITLWNVTLKPKQENNYNKFIK